MGKHTKHPDADDLELEQEEWNISYKRNMQLSKEWKLLFFGFQASRIFFRVVDNNNDKNENDTENDSKPEPKQEQEPQQEPQQEPEQYPTPHGQSKGGDQPPAPDDGLGF